MKDYVVQLDEFLNKIMVSEGFSKANSRNLPKVDDIMVAEFLSFVCNLVLQTYMELKLKVKTVC